jgi:ATP-dependent Lhr-like helicase
MTPPVTMFRPATQAWFEAAFAAPSDVQRRGWAAIAAGDHALLVAPTGSGKTLAAFLAALDRLTTLPADAPPGVRVLYISPLKALAADIERNLRAPLAGIRRQAELRGETLRDIRVDVRTGDTPAADRRLQARRPADILVTTPESLFLLLGSRARTVLATVHTVIVDELHALAGSKRGTHLALTLERLAALTAVDPQRIGLSATLQPLAEAAAFLGGDRPVTIVDAARTPRLAVTVTVPVPDMTNVPAPADAGDTTSILGRLSRQQQAEASPQAGERGLWSAIYPELVAAIRAHRSTIVFVNSRGLCERLAHKLNELAGEDLVQAHHGSVSHLRRAGIEEALKAGHLKAIVATSSLELGVDMGAVDLVVLVESPGTVARGLQRIGRAGHQVDAVSRGTIYPKYPGDLLEATVIAQRMQAGLIERLQVPVNALDVLAQQVVAMCVNEPRQVTDVEQMVRRAYPYRDLSRQALDGVLDMLAGKYSFDDNRELRPLLVWDRDTGELRARRGAAMAVRFNAGTIPDRGAYGVYLVREGTRLGELDEEMVHETRRGDVIQLGASSWRVEEIAGDRVVVSPAPGEAGRLPFWRGDGLGRPLEVGQAIGTFLRELAAQPRRHAAAWLRKHTPLDAHAATNLVSYVFDQRDATGALPTDDTIVVERFRDELGDWRVCVLTPFGARVHAPWAMALQARLGTQRGVDVQVMYTDNGLVLRIPDADEPPAVAELFPDPDEVTTLATDQVARTALFAGLFRENAVRSLLLRRRGPGKRTPLWAQRLKSQNLLALVQRYPAFPLVLETYRQCLGDSFDLAGLRGILTAVRSRTLRVHEVETRQASPFARQLVFAYVAAYMYEQDAPLAERRAQALTLDRNLLLELLGQDTLRELIDPAVLAALELELQRLADGRRARDADELHDVLRWLGDLTPAEAAARADGDGAAFAAALAQARRAVVVRIAGTDRLIAADDAGLYRDALGLVPPGGLPDAFLAVTVHPLQVLARRYARSRGPFHTQDFATRYGLTTAVAGRVLQELAAAGTLVLGEIRPGGGAPEWCDAEVLRVLKRRSLAALRRQVSPVDGAALARFLPEWHGIGSQRQGAERLLEAIAPLQGLALPWTALATTLLPARVAGFSLDLLDRLAASGAIAWVGAGALGPRDGRIALYLRERARTLLPPPADFPGNELHAAIVAVLGRRGATFLSVLDDDLHRLVPGPTLAERRAALWDLVWAGLVTNDTFAPLRGLGRSATRRGGLRLDPMAGGRWFLAQELADATLDPTRRTVARAELLLERYGIVSREVAAAEDLPGGFAPLYQVLKSMEEAGRIRRGYFVEGLSGAQFTLAGAVDRLRAVPADRPAAPLVLAAIDPANPYGTLLQWPGGERTAGEREARPRRVAGAWVILACGDPLLYVGPGARQLITFPALANEGALAMALGALASLPRTGRRAAVVVETIDGIPVYESPLAPALTQAGFRRDYRGLALGSTL